MVRRPYLASKLPAATAPNAPANWNDAKMMATCRMEWPADRLASSSSMLRAPDTQDEMNRAAVHHENWRAVMRSAEPPVGRAWAARARARSTREEEASAVVEPGSDRGRAASSADGREEEGGGMEGGPLFVSQRAKTRGGGRGTLFASHSRTHSERAPQGGEGGGGGGKQKGDEQE